MRVVLQMCMSTEHAKKIDSILTYPAGLVGTLFSFLIGFFVNNCYARYQAFWNSSMIGWSRINDLALQLFAYVPNREQAWDVCRLMHAANHLCYGDFAGVDMLPVCRRRHLLTAAEAATLGCPGGPQPFYLAACWALKRLAAPSADQASGPRVEPLFVLAMNKSIIEWREQTTLLPLLQMNPLPQPYIRNMVMLLLAFEVSVAAKIALAGLTSSTDPWQLAEEILIDMVLFGIISLVCQSLFSCSLMLLQPWGNLDADGETVDFPVEYWILLPLAGHRRLFAADADDSGGPTILPLAPEDETLLSRFSATADGRMTALLQKDFRPLAPPPSASAGHHSIQVPEEASGAATARLVATPAGAR